MTFLPIATRELRVAARKRSTFWLRVVAAIVGLVIGSACMMIASIGGMPTPTFGSALFGTLTWLALAAALAAGLFFTSDCLSEEKREGTLGFLFLTDLRGYDVVAGKLMATSLRGLFALLAIFPILAVTLLMGGVTGAQFWKTALALLNALFCSLSLGLFVSAISHDSQKAMAGTFCLLLLLVAGGPIADAIYGKIQGRGFVPFISLSSPIYLFITAGAWGRPPFWFTLLVTQGIAWFLFVLASLLIPRTWQQKASQGAMATRGWVYSWKYGGPARRASIRRKLLSRDAILWLACRERWQSLGIWIIALLLLAGFIAMVIGLPPEMWMGWRYLSSLFLFAFYLWAASQSCRFFVEARKSGLTELLLAAPLTEHQIVRGHWRALLRMYGWPVLLLLCLNLAGAALSQRSWTSLSTRATTAATMVATNSSGAITTTTVTNGSMIVTTTTTTATNGSIATSTTTTPAPTSVATSKSPKSVSQSFAVALAQTPQIAITVIAAALTGITTAANLVALCWFGMWMGLTSKNANFATLKTLAFVQIIPAMVIQFGSSIGVALLLMPMLYNASSNNPAFYMAWWPLITTLVKCSLAIVKDFGFFFWARNRLYRSFREQAGRSFNHPRLAIPPPVPPPAPPPIAPPPMMPASA